MSKYLLGALLAVLIAAPLLSQAVTVGPVKLEYSVDPGKTVKGEIFLQNEEAGTKTFYPSFEKFTEENGQKNFTKEGSDLATWFKMITSVTLKSGESRQIPFSIVVPKNAPPGGHFAVIWWSTSPPNAGKQQVSIVTRAGVLVYLTVSGEIKESATLEKFSTSRKIYSGLPLSFGITLKNTGNSYLKPEGEITVKNLFGGIKATLPVNEFGAIILPESSRDFNQTLESEKFFFGLYRARLDLTYGTASNRQSISDNSWLFVLPWKMLIFLILALTIVFFVIPRGIRKYNRWIIAKAKG